MLLPRYRHAVWKIEVIIIIHRGVLSSGDFINSVLMRLRIEQSAQTRTLKTIKQLRISCSFHPKPNTSNHHQQTMFVRTCANRSAIILSQTCSGRHRRWNYCTGTTTTAATTIRRSAGGWTGEKSSTGRRRWQSTTTTTPTTTTTTSTATTTNDDDDDGDNPVVRRYLREQLPTATAQTRRAVLAQLEPVFGRPITIAQLQSFSTAGLLDLAASIEATATTTTVVEPEKEGTAAEEEEKEVSSRCRPETMTTMMIPLHVYYDAPGRPPLKLMWKNPDRTSLLQALQDNIMTEHLLEASCGGNASCCSCHVLVSWLSDDEDDEPQRQRHTYYSLSPVQEAEQDMLDYAAEYDVVKSRLACQVRAVVVEKVTTTTTNDDKEETSTIMPTLSVTIPGTVNDLWK
jgi:ferredoxin